MTYGYKRGLDNGDANENAVTHVSGLGSQIIRVKENGTKRSMR